VRAALLQLRAQTRQLSVLTTVTAMTEMIQQEMSVIKAAL